ncbi:MAG: MBOAT family O-acyltransferase [Bacteroidota bacterium]|nr:MBOAT family O-acyltransferase [Bacteroidota bacterium]
MQLLTWILPVFLLILVSVNFLLPSRFRMVWQLLGSCVFIAWFSWQALLVAAFISLVNFVAVRKVKENKQFFYSLLVFNIGCIILGNYIVTYQTNLQFQLTQISFSLKPVVLTLGLSFYTLQHIAYSINCRRGTQNPETNFLQFMFCSLYFPKFLSGPLTKHEELKAQLSGQEVNQANMISGFNRLLLGVFKKMVIADRLAPSVHSVFDFANDYSGLTIFSAALLFTIQLYFDFSGYTDMALGASKMLGINLPENFNLPLRSLSISEFWRRWHISLIRFFTNYVFYPVSYKFRKYKSLAASVGIAGTFLLSGIWHGLGLPFMLWAICHLVYLQIELFTKGIRNVNSILMKSFGWLLTILAVTFSNVFFRSPGSDALITNTKKLFDFKNFFPKDYIAELLAPLAVGGQQWNFFNFYLVLTLAFGFLLFERRINTQSIKTNFSVVYTTILLLLIFLFGIFSSGEQFIYVQF